MPTTPEKIGEAFVEIGGRTAGLDEAMRRAKTMFESGISSMGAMSGRFGSAAAGAFASVIGFGANLVRTFGDIEDAAGTVIMLMSRLGESPAKFGEAVGVIREMAPAMNQSTEAMTRMLIPMKQMFVYNQDLRQFFTAAMGAWKLTGMSQSMETVVTNLARFRIHGGDPSQFGLQMSPATGPAAFQRMKDVMRALEEAGKGAMEIEAKGVGGALRGTIAGLKELYDGIEELAGEAALAYEVPEKLRAAADWMRQAAMGMRGVSNVAESQFGLLGAAGAAALGTAHGLTFDQQLEAGKYGFYFGQKGSPSAMPTGPGSDPKKPFQDLLDKAKAGFKDAILDALPGSRDALDAAKKGFSAIEPHVIRPFGIPIPNPISLLKGLQSLGGLIPGVNEAAQGGVDTVDILSTPGGRKAIWGNDAYEMPRISERTRRFETEYQMPRITENTQQAIYEKYLSTLLKIEENTRKLGMN